MNNTSALGALRRRWWIVLLLALLGAVLGAIPKSERVADQQIDRTFSATHTMLVNNTDSVTAGSSVSPNQVALLATTGDVPERVRDELDYSGNAAELASQVEVLFDFATGALTFSTEQGRAETAEAIADAFADETSSYLAERQDEDYEQRLSASNERLADLETELDVLTAGLANAPDDPALQAQRDAISRQYSVAFEQNQALSATPPVLAFTTLQRAQAVDVTDESGSGISAPTSRRTRALLGLLAGAAVGIVVGLVLGRLDRKIRTREQAEELLGMRGRVTIPKVADDEQGGLVVVTGRHDALSDSYRTLRNLVGFIQGGAEPTDHAPITLVVSPGPGDGKTSAAANLGAAFRETGERTVLVNTDFRRPRLALAVRDSDAPPLPFTYEDLSAVKPKSLLTRTKLSGLALLDLSGMDGTAGELSRATAHIMPEVATLAEQVVIDSSPVGATAEVLDMVPFADVIVIVVRVGHTSIDAASRTVAVLRDVSTAPMVLVLTGMKQAKTPYYEYTDRRTSQSGERVGILDRLRRHDEVERHDEPVG
jgi:Mrp family chromosome partitioning ATPase